MTGEELRILRKRFGLSQVDVARAAGIARPELSAIENGPRGTEESHQQITDAIRSLARPSQALTDETRAALRQVFSNYGAGNVRIFGSVARGTDKPGSDLDLIAVFPDGFSLFGMVALIEDLERVLGLRVDVVSDGDYASKVLAQARQESVAL